MYKILLGVIEASIYTHSRALLDSCLILVSCLAYSSTLKMEVVCSSETLVDFQQTTLRYIPEDCTIYNHRCENLKSYKFK
jgi:hypothetical protein